jgi:hypothetical protein
MVLYMHHLTRDLRERERGREKTEKEIPALEFDELEPEAMAMSVCVWWRWW